MAVVRYITLRLFAWMLMLIVMLVVSLRMGCVLREQDKQEEALYYDFDRFRDREKD